MNKPYLSVALLVWSLVSSVAWAFTSHKYDCFNIGPCRGDLDFWLGLGDIAFYSFFGSWLALLGAAALISNQFVQTSSRAFAWLISIMFPPVALLSASWIFNIGVKVADV